MFVGHTDGCCSFGPHREQARPHNGCVPDATSASQQGSAEGHFHAVERRRLAIQGVSSNDERNFCQMFAGSKYEISDWLVRAEFSPVRIDFIALI